MTELNKDGSNKVPLTKTMTIKQPVKKQPEPKIKKEVKNNA